jgi:murein DD-endopeptidase MepM/ murein hydrolase activator NlpD
MAMKLNPVQIIPNGSTVPGLPALIGGPFDKDLTSVVTSPYGPREPVADPDSWDGTKFTRYTGNFHWGIDLWNVGWDVNPPRLVALFSGRVTILIQGDESVGNWIRVEDAEDGWSFEYYHLSGFAPGLAVGDVVQAGDYLGDVGNTGLSTGNHLHMQIRLASGLNTDPLITIPMLQQLDAESSKAVPVAAEAFTTIGALSLKKVLNRDALALVERVMRHASEFSFNVGDRVFAAEVVSGTDTPDGSEDILIRIAK